MKIRAGEPSPANGGRGSARHRKMKAEEDQMRSGKSFYLDKSNGKLMGVCAGIADYTGWDATLIRIGLVLVTLLGCFPWTLIAYGVVAWVAKPRPAGSGGFEDFAP